MIDLTSRDQSNDQLSAYYPLNAQYELAGPVTTEGAKDEAADGRKGKSVTLVFRGPAADKRSTAEVAYTLTDGEPWLKIVTRVTNTGDQPLDIGTVDAIRADGEFDFAQLDDLGLFYAYDQYWQQAYGAQLIAPAGRIVASILKRGERPNCGSKQRSHRSLCPPARRARSFAIFFRRRIRSTC